MKTSRLILPTALLSIGLYTASLHAQYEGYTPGRLMEELTRNIQQYRQLETALKDNRRIKQDYAREKAGLDRERSDYDRDVEAYNADLADYNAAVTRYDNQCDRKLDRQAFDACEALADRLEPRKAALDQRLRRLNQRKAAINEKVRAWNDRELERANAAEELLGRYDQYDASIEALTSALNNLPAVRSSGRDCTASPSPEATQQCFRKILDASRQ